VRARTWITLAALAAALLAATVARGATTDTVGVTANVATGNSLTVAANGTPSFNVTLNGNDQTPSYTLPVEVIDSRGLATGGGWHLTVTSTQFSDGAGHSLSTGASTMTAVTTGCGPGSAGCNLPTGNTVSYSSFTIPAAATAPSAISYFSAASPSGRGRIDVNAAVTVAIPASTFAATYTSTVTVSVLTGP
jgi:WxL domain surface cell wall-binding